MKVFFITQEEPFYLPEFFDRVIKANNHYFAGITILSSASPKQGIVRFIYEHFLLFGFFNFIIQSILFVYYKVMNGLSRLVRLKKFYSVTQVALHYGIKLYKTRNINSKYFLKVLKEINPDVIVSVASSQVFRKGILEIPVKGCINVHGAPLPRYRGKLPSFWVLANGEKEGAVTIHYMDERLDNGKIILQESFNIEKKDTLDSFIKKSKRLGAGLLIEALKQIENNTLKLTENDASQATYFSFPRREDVRKFLGEGRRFR